MPVPLYPLFRQIEHLLGGNAGVDADVLEGAVEAVDVLFHAKAHAAERADRLKHLVAL